MSKATTKKSKPTQDEESQLPPKRAKPVVFQIRITQETIDRLTEIAQRKEVPASTLARMWLLERLAQERKVLYPPSRFGEWI